MNCYSHKLGEHELRLFSWVSEFHLSYVTYLVLIHQYFHSNNTNMKTNKLDKKKNLPPSLHKLTFRSIITLLALSCFVGGVINLEK